MPKQARAEAHHKIHILVAIDVPDLRSIRARGGDRIHHLLPKLLDPGDRARVRVEAQVPVVAEVTPAALADLKLAEGGEVWVYFKATDVAVYPA